MASELILTINPGSTSTKIAIFDGEKEIYSKTLRHAASELSKYTHIVDQLEFREGLVFDALKESGVALESLGAIVGRGGLVKPVESGAYEVNDRLLEDLRKGVQGEHASNLGGLLAKGLSERAGGKPLALIADPVVVDEMADIARVSGLPFIRRRSIFHALNQKAIARRYAASVGKRYEELNLIVAHLEEAYRWGRTCMGAWWMLTTPWMAMGPLALSARGRYRQGNWRSFALAANTPMEKSRSYSRARGGWWR